VRKEGYSYKGRGGKWNEKEGKGKGRKGRKMGGIGRGIVPTLLRGIDAPADL